MEWKLTKWYILLLWILIGFILTIFSLFMFPTGLPFNVYSKYFLFYLISLTIFFTGAIYSIICLIAWIVRKIKK